LFIQNVALRQHYSTQSGLGPGKGTTMKSEVRALEQAVCGLVTKLDILLTAEFGLRLLEAGKGLHISTPDHLSEYKDDAFVTVRPVGWSQTSRISARFFYTMNGWELYEGGEISADHLSIPVGRLHFKPSDDGMGIHLEPMAGYERHFVANGYARLIMSLQKDAAAHQ